MLLVYVLLLLPLVADPTLCSENKTSLSPQTQSPVSKSEVELPSPSLLQGLYQMFAALLESDREADSRQGGVNNGFRLTLGALLALILATVFGVVGFGSVGLLAAKALSVGTLALFLTAMSSLKKHHDDSSGQTVHFVPIHSGHHEYFRDRAEYLPPYLDRNV